MRGLKLMTLFARHLAIQVAPHTGAWIEIDAANTSPPPDETSHPIRVRGLKSLFTDVRKLTGESHPIRVRGLKYFAV